MTSKEPKVSHTELYLHMDLVSSKFGEMILYSVCAIDV